MMTQRSTSMRLALALAILPLPTIDTTWISEGTPVSKVSLDKKRNAPYARQLVALA